MKLFLKFMLGAFLMLPQWREAEVTLYGCVYIQFYTIYKQKNIAFIRKHGFAQGAFIQQYI